VIVEKRRPQVQFEEVQIRSTPVYKPPRELIVEEYDTVAVPQRTEVIEREILPSVQVY
jgi:hypothetical protein